MGYVRAYRPGDELDLVPRLRDADLREIKAATDASPLDVLREGAEQSVPSCTIIGNYDTVAGMFGATREGRVWLLGSEELVTSPLNRQFLRECRRWCDKLHDLYPLLWNVIDERNEVHIRWLKWMGFTFINKKPYGPHGLPFLEFVRIKQDV
jgi:hypothetical protein